jgi:LPXTG-site transpeptidase (sortase) family protein
MATTHGSGQLAAAPPDTRRRRVYWTLGNLMLLGGVYLLLYVGGLYAQAEYYLMAARGDSDIEAPPLMMGANAPSADIALPAPAAPAALGAAPAAPPREGYQAPVLNGQIASEPPDPASAAHVGTVQRVIIPSIKVDSKVIEVGWDLVEQGGQQVAVWQVAEYAVGQHKGSANPGEGGNIVLAGHVGGFGKVFRDLYYVKPGDQMTIYSAGRQYVYIVQERLLVTEEGVSPEQRAANALLIGPTDREVVTMITCWPPSGRDKFTERVIVRAVPFEAAAPPVADLAPQTAR